jgi:phosphohistidine swiveling domain-containing protein
MLTTAPQSLPRQLPVPEGFHFEWDSPEEATRFWAADLMHFPNGLSPLSATMDMPAFVRGMMKASESLSMPFDTESSAFKVINGYVYSSLVPFSTDPVEMEARLQQMQRRMQEHVPGLLNRWRTQYEPEVRTINDETLKGDYSKLSDRDVVDLLEKLVSKREREGELHFLAVFPAGGAFMIFEQVYTQLFGEPKQGEHLALLQGFPNKSVEIGTGLWHLAREAKNRPEVLKALHELAPASVHAALADVAGGAAFLGAVDEFLDQYGWRGAELDVASPTWREDPAPVYNLIREYTGRDVSDPEENLRVVVAAREARERMLFERLTGGSAEMFRHVLAGAQQYLPITEDHNFWIDQQGLSVQRVPALEAGRRLAAAGRIDTANEVFFLAYDEVTDALRGGKGSLRQLVERRRNEREKYRHLNPPPALGTPPPPEVEEDPIMSKFFGSPPPEAPDPRLINGNAASNGTVKGVARVIRSLDDAERLNPGEILVCPSTMPAWTPLFALASAIVTDHGGVLSHTAIVAREYGIPSVVGTKVATSLIRDGQTITVDGTAGSISLES